ncbi:MAG: DivIVA domain-containing protein [Oscillospiraceae bacterium]|nr:DivIVA domain-containing protein [Oscillospiraceae bacterium]
MLTIDEIKDVKFRTGRGQSFYRAEDVDAFIDEVVETFEHKNNEKAELVHKMDILATRIEQYRSDEETVRNALLSAQKVADTTLKDANEQAEAIISEAKEKSDKLIREAQKETVAEKEAIVKLQKIAKEMRMEILKKINDCVNLVDSLPDDDTLNAIKKKLDKEFPTLQAAPEEVPADNEEEKIIDVVEEIENAEKEDANVASVTENTTKFGVLKFGSNYDVE